MKLVILLCATLCSAFAANAAEYKQTCDEKPKTGHCLAYFRRYYYDAESQTCKKFIYGGCQGNGNRYETEEECLANCKRTQQADDADKCSLESETGPCRAAFPRYFFNKKTGKCELFIYGGCQGNANNFVTKEECDERCSAAVGTQNTLMCRLEKDAGPCKAYVNRFYYDYRTSQCKEFVYGGCQGNENNFLTETDCRKACGSGTQRPSDLVCGLNPDAGPCRAFVTRYYYDKLTRQCKEFVYGGCQGNENNFLSQSDCMSACGNDVRPPQSLVCQMEKDQGPCDAYIQRYYYDHLLKQCRQFVYGGCKGNENNFKTEAECRNTCGGTTTPNTGGCNESPDTGSCRGSFTRYYYNPITRNCDTFIYGGCGGNRNNFNTYQDCMKTCGAI